MTTPEVSITKTFRFEAAHRLPHLPPDHQCSRMHGHSFQVDVELTGPMSPTYGWLRDFGEVKDVFAKLDAELDHHLLNDVPGLENPTSEVLAVWIFDRLVADLPELSSVTVHETCTSACTYRGRRVAA